MYTVGLVLFPGSNCDEETYHFLNSYVGLKVNKIWHKDTNIQRHDMYVLPGGFSYGDYLRPGKLATFSPALIDIRKHVSASQCKIIGICNGFQILCELGLLPGTLRQNLNCQFICKTVSIYDTQETYRVPIAHGEGNYYHPNPEKLNVAYRYTNNPNGSTDSIAALYNWSGNVLGMMPHPERAFKSYHASKDGYKIFDNFGLKML